MFVKSSSNIGYGAKWVAYSRFMQNETPDSNFEYIEHTKLVRVIQKYNYIESIASRSLDRGCKYKIHTKCSCCSCSSILYRN